MTSTIDRTSKEVNYGKIVTVGLVAVSIVPQLGMTIITPALNDMASDFHVDTAKMQYILVSFMAGYALSMLFSGILADRFGPVAVQVFGMTLFVAASVVCALAPSLATLIIARFFQALGGCSGTVVTRLIARRDGSARSRMALLSTLAMAIAVTPCCAPVLGAALLNATTWRLIFAVVAVLGAVATILFRLACPPDHYPERHPAQPRTVLKVYLRNIRNSEFRYFATAISLAWMSYFIFTSCAPSPLQQGLGVSALGYSLISAAAAAGYTLGSLAIRGLAHRYPIERALLFAGASCAVGGLAATIATAALPRHSWALAAPTIILLVGVGIAIPACQAGMLRVVRDNPGVASGLFFFTQMIAGALYAALVNYWAPTTITSVAVLMLIPAAALLALCLTRRNTAVSTDA